MPRFLSARPDPELITLPWGTPLEEWPLTNLVALPRGKTTARMFESESIVSDEGPRTWRLTVKGRARRTYRLQASLRTLRRPFRPCSVRLGGRLLPRGAWSHRESTGVLRATFRAKRASVTVGRCRR